MRLSVVIVNFNGARFLQDALDTILASQIQGEFEVIVVDNDSKDDSKHVLGMYKNRVRVVYNDDNIGFAAANNQGVDLAVGEFVFLLNNDTRTDPSTCARLMDALLANPLIGAVGPKLINADGTEQLAGGILGQRQYKTSVAKSVSFLSGAALMMSRERYLELGGFDEAFFFYNEDLDLCKRIQKSGYTLCFLPTSEVVHLGGQSTQFLRKKSLIEGYRGGLYFCYKHYGFFVYFLYRLILIPVLVLMVLFYAITGWSFVRREQAMAFVEILYRVLVKGYQR
jgi:GT2 family glycosyltransferase